MAALAFSRCRGQDAVSPGKSLPGGAALEVTQSCKSGALFPWHEQFRTETGIHAQFGLLDDTKGSFASGKHLEAAGSNVDGSIN
jgi:hypothetical protein